MMRVPQALLPLIALCLALHAGTAPADVPQTPAAPLHPGETGKPFEPVSGQAGKDVVWVPTPPALVEKMLDLAKVTPSDYVMDLGSGDGRNIIAAAKRGARALGVEYNPAMVELSKQIADQEGVDGKAQFIQGDMYEADISQATVLALFLLPENLDKLVGRFLDLAPGTRIVLNTFGIRGWNPDRSERAGVGCGAWCDALLYIVPARAAGRWQLAEGSLLLEQNFQMLTGSFESGGMSKPLSNGRLAGDRISFTLDGMDYQGVVAGDAMIVRARGDVEWRASRARD